MQENLQATFLSGFFISKFLYHENTLFYFVYAYWQYMFMIINFIYVKNY